MKRSTVVALAALILAAVACGEGAEERSADERQVTVSGVEGLQLSVTPRSETYTPDGTLEVEVTLVNTADSVIRFRPIFSFGRWLDADIRGPDGELLEKTAAIDPPNAWPVSLDPGQSITETVTAPYDLTRPGPYRVAVRFTMPCDIRGCDDPVTVHAPPVTIRVDG